MPLNDLTLIELVEMADIAATLCRVGHDLEANGITPTFDLTPGLVVTMRLDVLMPDAQGQTSAVSVEWDAPGHDEDPTRGFVRELVAADAAAERGSPVLATFDTPTSPEAAPVATGDVAPVAPVLVAADLPEPVEMPPASGERAGGDYSHDPEDEIDERAFASAAPSRSEAAAIEGKADSGGGQASAAANSPPAAPPVLSHQNNFLAPGWTDDEDTRLIAFVVTSVTQLGTTKRAAILGAAKELGRPAEGTYFRCNHKLKARLDAALAEADAYRKQPDPTPSPEVARQDAPPPVADGQGERAEPLVGDAPAPEPEAGAGASPEIAPEPAPEPAPASFVADPVTSHLMALSDKGGWTVDRDLELMELSIAGWMPNEVALQLKVQANMVKPRFDALTGLYEDAGGKKVRRFARDAVFAALTRLAGKAA